MHHKKTKRGFINKYILSIGIQRDDDYNIEITSINFNKDFLQNSIFNFTTHLMNIVNTSFNGIKVGVMLTPDNIIDEVKDNQVIPFYALTSTEISRLEEISMEHLV